MMTKIPDPTTKDLRSFGLIFGILVAAIFGLLLPYIFSHSLPRWPWIVLALFAGFALILPIALKPVYIVWMYFGLLMSKITTPLVMGIAFYFVFFPIGLIMRIFGSDPLGRKFDPAATTYKISCSSIKKDNLEKPF